MRRWLLDAAGWAVVVGVVVLAVLAVRDAYRGRMP